MRLLMLRSSIIFLLICSSAFAGEEKSTPVQIPVLMGDGESVQNFGYYANKKESDRVYQSLPKAWHDQLVRLSGKDENTSAYNWRFLYKALQEAGTLSSKETESGRLSALNQGNVGSCVGYSSSQSLDILMATNAYARKQLLQIWRSRVNPDAIYGITRYDHLGGWDGSTGGWAVEGFKKYGTLHRFVYGSFDLTQPKPENGRSWAKSGLPKELIKEAIEHQLISSTRLSTTSEARAALQNGYTIIVCAQASYPNTRDKDGFSRRNGRAWSHAMAVVGYRGVDTGREGFLILNSWGDTWNDGGVFPPDMPFGSFWVTPEDLKYHIDQEDSWAFAGYNGFIRQEVDWEQVFNFDGRL